MEKITKSCMRKVSHAALCINTCLLSLPALPGGDLEGALFLNQLTVSTINAHDINTRS